MNKVTTIILLFAFMMGGILSSAAQNGEEIDKIKDTLSLVKTDSAAFLNSSFGEDRLGGNKMNFIDKEIILKVTGQTGSLYRVALSQNRYAFIPKEMTTPLQENCLPTYITKQMENDSLQTVKEITIKPALTGSFSARNTGKEEKVTIALDHACPYLAWEEKEPHRLIVEIYGAVNNSVWLTQSLNLESIESVEVRQTDSDITTLIINIKKKSSWGYNIWYSGNNLNISIKHPPYFSLRGLTIGVDAGHGGTSTGAVSVKRDEDKVLNMEMVYRLKRLLEKKGAKIVLSREGDNNVSMQRRKEIFRDNNIDLMISIHCNAGGKSAQGTSTYYKHLVYRPLAEYILKNLVTIEGVKEFGLIGNFNFSLSAATNYPAILVETLFLSNPSDTEMIENPEIREELMKKVVKGVEDYLKYCKKIEKR